MADLTPDDLAVVVVTYNAMPWLEQCLASVADLDSVVVDHGSVDGTLQLVRGHQPAVRLVEQENLGLAAGWKRGLAETRSRHVLLLNSDAWLVADAAERLVAVADRNPRAAVVGPKLLNPDGTLQRSVRGFPTAWRLATEYAYLRKLAPRSRALNAFYGAGFDHESERATEFLMGACLLVRRAAVEDVGPPDTSYFMFGEEVDWCWRFVQAGWTVLFTPEARVVHVGGASHGGRLFQENVRGHLHFLRDHRGRAEAKRAQTMLRATLTVRGRLYRGDRGRQYRDAAAWLGSGDLDALIAQ